MNQSAYFKYLLFFVMCLAPVLFASDWQGFEHAREQIKIHRMADVAINVIDAKGLPVQGASVRVEMQNHAFPFGAAFNSLMAFTSEGPNPEHSKYLEVFKENFNSAVLENGMKWGVMTNNDGSPDIDNREKMQQGVAWLEQHDIPLRGHNGIWPSWRNTPDYLHDLRLQPDTLRRECENRIETIVSMFKGELTDWDLVNEPAEHRDIINILGEDVMIDWYHQAHQIDPQTPMYVNQWAVLNGVYHKSFLQWVRYLAASEKASLDGIGLQGHATVEQFTEPEQLASVWEILDDYREFGLPIKITEFDVEGYKGEDLQARALENALTLFFSHPSVAGFTAWGFWDGRHWRNSEKWSMTGENEQAGFWRQDWTEKQAAKIWKRLVFDEWWTDESGITGSNAVFQTRGFLGDYEIFVQHGDQSKTVPLTLTGSGAEMTVQLD